MTMREFASPAIKAALQVCLLLGCYFVSRCVFVLLNWDQFNWLSISTFLTIAFQAVRFDVSALLMLNIPYLFLLFLPLPAWKTPARDKFLQVIFIVGNSIALAFEFSDWAYYPFTLKRSTADVLDMVARKGDFWVLLPHFIIDYWFVPAGLIIMIVLLIIINRKITRLYPLKPMGNYIVGSMCFLLVMGLCVIGIRGGLQKKPLDNAYALKAAGTKNLPVMLNTPFSIMHSMANQKLEPLHFYSGAELKQYFIPVKQYQGKPFTPKNVVVIIVESLSKQFTGLGPRKSFTPFLDSLMNLSYVWTNAYANALHSAEAVPAIIAGIPPLMEEPFTTSYYGTNQITALPALLKEKGYTSSFYHGGTNGTMNFDAFCANAGYDKYYGRTEYNNENDYDGNWGIWDEPYLQYFASEISRMKQPFFTTVFTLSSHDPFKVPGQYKNSLLQGPLPVQQCVAYADMALKSFFEKISKMQWFQNTLFVIVADHCSLQTEDERDHYNMGFYKIPIIFYSPGDSLRGRDPRLVQQIDILPSILDHLGYDKPFFSFGHSMFREDQQAFAINYLGGTYSWQMNGCILKSKGMKLSEVYDITTDSFCSNNLLLKPDGENCKKAAAQFKAFVQLHNKALIDNKMTVTQ
jgi:phosphoglycerol transferase MdoB-like AlkP superfamily enzyme